MRWFYWLMHTVLCALYYRTYTKYMRCDNISKVQEDKLKEILLTNKTTCYGKKNNFSNIDTIKAYQGRVPLSNYEDYRTYINKIACGDKFVLTREDVLLFEPTSGSSSAVKLIPYTKKLKAEFQEGVKVWLYHLYTSYPELKYGKSYWSISPSLYEKKLTSAHIPIGFEKDSEYLGTLGKYFMDKILVTPKGIEQAQDIQLFYFNTALALLSSPSLRLISIWSPSFLLLLLDFINDNRKSLVKKLDYKNSQNIKNAFREFDNSNVKNYSLIWKELKVISCWTDAHSSHYLENLKELFPYAIIEAKGILATEGIVSIPVGDKEGSRLSYYSHFYEFLEGESQKIYLAHELKIACLYEVIITTSGGLYRYQTGDMIEVTALKDSIPVIKFIGRKGLISDFYGEKLCEAFISHAFKKFTSKFTSKFISMEHRENKEKVKEQNHEPIEFFMITPDYVPDYTPDYGHGQNKSINRYIFYYKSKASLTSLAVDTVLRSNFHYDYCRTLGQLQEIVLFRLTGNPEKEYVQYYIKKGMRLGDVKLKTLSLERDWHTVFTGYRQV